MFILFGKAVLQMKCDMRLNKFFLKWLQKCIMYSKLNFAFIFLQKKIEGLTFTLKLF